MLLRSENSAFLFVPTNYKVLTQLTEKNMNKYTEIAAGHAKEVLKNSGTACLHLYKIMIPVIITVKILQELEVIQYLAWPLKPFMTLVGLPPEMGLAWATALVNNIYSGIIVMFQLWADNPLSTAQVTVLGAMILVAHGLPVEGEIARKSGAKLPFQLLSRVGGALILGMILNAVYSGTGFGTEPATLIMSSEKALMASDKTLAQWAFSEGKNLVAIYFIILGLMVLLKILTALGVTGLMDKLLRPVLGAMGIGPKASAITVIGLTLGLSYGGGMIIVESKSGNIGKHDVFYSLTLMGLCHSLIEDTLLFLMVGAQFSGVFWGRLIFSIVAVAAVVRVARILPGKFCDRYLWG